jgi:Xaa-Pro aminopeptidase
MKKVPSFFPMIGTMLKPYLKGKKRVAVGECCVRALTGMVRNADSGIEVSDAENYGERLRVIKDAGEVDKLRRVAEFTDYAMGIVAKALKPGITPAEVRELIAAIALTHGLQGISFSPAVICVQSGAPGSQELFNYPDDEPIKEGTAIGFDYGYVLNGYVSDYGRSFYVGRNQQAKDAYKALHEAQLHLLDKIKPGEPLNMCFDVLYDKLETRSMGKYLRKAEDCLIMGHQIGIEVHERPWLRADVQGVFEPGMVMCVEPKIMWPGLCYLRCEDMVLVTEKGCEPLTKFDRDLFELT